MFETGLWEICACGAAIMACNFNCGSDIMASPTNAPNVTSISLLGSREKASRCDVHRPTSFNVCSHRPRSLDRKSGRASNTKEATSAVPHRRRRWRPLQMVISDAEAIQPLQRWPSRDSAL